MKGDKDKMITSNHIHCWQLPSQSENHDLIGTCTCGAVRQFPFTFDDALECSFRRGRGKRFNPLEITEGERSARLGNGKSIKLAERRASKRMSLKEDNL